MIHTVKGVGIVNKAEIDVFLELSCFFDDPADVGNSISGSSAFSKTSLNIWKFMVQLLLKPGLENFKHCFISVWDECNTLQYVNYTSISWEKSKLWINNLLKIGKAAQDRPNLSNGSHWKLHDFYMSITHKSLCLFTLKGLLKWYCPPQRSRSDFNLLKL